jgi:hypothetical protein
MFKLALFVFGSFLLAQTTQKKIEITSKETSAFSPKFEAKNTKLVCDATGICQVRHLRTKA